MVDAELDGAGSALSNIGDARVRFNTATMRIRSNRITGSLLRGDEEILKECGYRDANEYWDVAMSEEMTVSDFVTLLEGHLLDPGRTADEIHGRAVRISKLVEDSLHKAWQNGESWFIGAKDANSDFTKSRVRPREAAMWLLGRPLHKDRLPATLCAYLENQRPENGKLGGSSRAASARGGRTRERRDEAMKFLLTKYPPDGQPPKGRPLSQLLKDLNLELKARNYEPISRDTLRLALKDLRSPTHLTQMKQNL